MYGERPVRHWFANRAYRDWRALKLAPAGNTPTGASFSAVRA